MAWTPPTGWRSIRVERAGRQVAFSSVMGKKTGARPDIDRLVEALNHLAAEQQRTNAWLEYLYNQQQRSNALLEYLCNLLYFGEERMPPPR
jgi:hypothetical protein